VDASLVTSMFGLVASRRGKGKHRGTKVSTAAHPPRRIFASREVVMDDVQVIGYDLDYTLVHYNLKAWEGAVYAQCKEILSKKGFEVEGLEFDSGLVIRGLVIDAKLGNIVKVDRYGYVRKALHGNQMLSVEDVNEVYGRQRCRVDLRESRWTFINTLFSVANCCLFCQLVERIDQEYKADDSPLPVDYAWLARSVGAAVSEAHVDGILKERILEDPTEYVELDSEAPIVLLDQKLAGKRLVLITNNDWEYTRRMMSYAYDRYLPPGLTWRSLFDVVITNAQKPDFWTLRMPLWEVIDEERGLTHSTPRAKMKAGKVYCGGHARMVEECFGYGGQQVMYVGDHIYADTNVAKSIVQWQTCLIMRELEGEVRALAQTQQRRKELGELLVRRDKLLQQRGMRRVKAGRQRLGISTEFSFGLQPAHHPMEENNVTFSEEEYKRVCKEIDRLDDDWFIEGINERWGFMTRVGLHEKSHLFRQVEKYADIYTSRVSNFLASTPFTIFRPPLQSDRNFLDSGSEQAFSDYMCDLVGSWGPFDEAFRAAAAEREPMHWGATNEHLTREQLELAAEQRDEASSMAPDFFGASPQPP